MARPYAFVFCLALSIAAPASAIDTWWLHPDGRDPLDLLNFGNPDNWNNGDPENEDVYVTSSDAEATPDEPAEAVAEFDETLEVGQTYIGGWKSDFDTPHGDPLGHGGTLDILDGLLETEANAGSPPCAYIRVGYRGANGTVNQSGGTVKSCSGISMNYSSPQGNGSAIWNLSGGEIDSWGLDVGTQGFGFFNMTGGNVHDDSFEDTGETRATIGRGYQYPDLGFAPGFGVMSQTAGTHETELLELGFEEGSMGAYSLREDASLNATTRISVGYGGTGIMTVAGNASVTSPYIHVGQGAAGFGQLTVHTGTVSVTGVGGLQIGKASGGGLGHLALTGIGANVSASSFYLYDRSRFTVYFAAGAVHNSKVEVSGTATIYANSEFFVKPVNGYTPTVNQTFTILCASTISYASLPVVKPNNWKLVPPTSATCASGAGQKLELQYCGTGAC
jgi:hypothetical protein